MFYCLQCSIVWRTWYTTPVTKKCFQNEKLTVCVSFDCFSSHPSLALGACVNDSHHNLTPCCNRHPNLGVQLSHPNLAHGVYDSHPHLALGTGV